MRPLLAALLALAAVACATPTPTPTPPHGLPPLALPADEAPHAFATEWWYFNVHLAGPAGARFTLHDVLFQVREPASGRALYVRQQGLTDVGAGTHVEGERLRSAEAVPAGPANGFAFDVAGAFTGADGERFRLAGTVDGYAYDLALSSQAPALVHDADGLVDSGPAGITYYYSRPRLEVSGTLTPPGGAPVRVAGLGWYDKQWGDFVPVAVAWDWASVQLDDGTDLMVSVLWDGGWGLVDAYATLRRAGGQTLRLGDEDFTFAPVGADAWESPRTGTRYPTRWRFTAPAHGLDLTLAPAVVASETASAVLGVAYWEAGVDVRDGQGARVGQGFVELSWPRGTTGR
jgi:predicted secreted hydrolase